MPVNLSLPPTVKQGTVARCSATFTAGSPLVNTDPGAVSFKVYKPDGTTVAPTSVRDGVGLYHADLDTTTGVIAGFPGGMYLIEATGTAPVAEVLDSRLFVEALGF
ncbi:MAG TPA: hypothetical protein VGR57_12175 [Ktedonobacterales bacterium]|nr:hypothetical protein [Ktedonobacterales bacterium]